LDSKREAAVVRRNRLCRRSVYISRSEVRVTPVRHCLIPSLSYPSTSSLRSSRLISHSSHLRRHYVVEPYGLPYTARTIPAETSEGRKKLDDECTSLSNRGIPSKLGTAASNRLRIIGAESVLGHSSRRSAGDSAVQLLRQ